MRKEHFCWRSGYRLEKFHEGSVKPFEVREGKGNIGLEEGFNELWALVIGGSANHFAAATLSQIGVGDSSVAANATQTDLQATPNILYKGMTTGYPTSKAEVGKMYFRSEFATNEANFAWEEWSVKQSVSSLNLNRKVENLGTKNGGTWALEIYLALQNA